MTGRSHCPLCHGKGYLEEHHGPPHNPSPSGYAEPCDLCEECYACGRPLSWEPPEITSWDQALQHFSPPAWLVVSGRVNLRLRPHCPSCVLDLEDYLGYLADATAAAEGDESP